jgi:hypothetical protein
MPEDLDTHLASEYVDALIRERDQYVRAGLDDRVAEVDAVLAQIGASVEAPAKTASKRAASAKPAKAPAKTEK